MSDFVERLLNKPKPLHEIIHGECENCGKEVLLKYVIGAFYCECECGHLNAIEKIGD